MNQIIKSHLLSMSAFLAGSIGAFADNGIRIVGAQEVVSGWEPKKYEIIVDNDDDVQLTSFQLRMQVPEGFEIVGMPVATDRIPKTGKLQAVWKGNDASTGEMYITFIKNDLTTYIGGKSGTAVAEFWMRPKNGYQLEEQEDGTWSKSVNLQIWDEELTAVKDGKDVAIDVDNADNNDLSIKVVADRIAMYTEQKVKAAYPIDYNENYNLEEDVDIVTDIPFDLFLDNTVGCSSLSFIIETEGLEVLDVHEEADRLQGAYAINELNAPEGKHIYKVTCSNPATNNAITDNFGRFVTIHTQMSAGYKGKDATLVVRGIELSPIDGSKVYDGKGCTASVENLAWTDNETAWANIQADLESLKPYIDTYNETIDKMEYAKRNEEYSGFGDEVQAWINDQLGIYGKKHDNVELSLADGVKEQVEKYKNQLAIEMPSEACKYDLGRYLNGVKTVWNGAPATEDTAAIDGMKDYVSALGDNDIDEEVKNIDNLIDALTARYDALVGHDEDDHAKFIADVNDIEGKIANVTTYTTVLNDLADLKKFIEDNYDAEVAQMMYASRYEGVEVTVPIDAVRDWIADTEAEYLNKFKNGELTAEDGVKGDVASQKLAVLEALMIAAKYDASRYLNAANNAWFGDEENEIVGAGENVYVKLKYLEDLGVAGASSVQEAITGLEDQINNMKEEYDNYVSYPGYEEHNAKWNELYSIVINGIPSVVFTAAETVNDAAMGEIKARLQEIEEKANFVNGVFYGTPATEDAEGKPGFMWLSRIENELKDTPQDALAWIEETLATYQARHDAEVDEEADPVVAPEEWLDENDCIAAGIYNGWMTDLNDALNAVAKADAEAYDAAANAAWYGIDEDDTQTEGAKQNILDKMATLGAGANAIQKQIVLLEAQIKELDALAAAYPQYSEENHQEIIDKYNAILNNIEDIKAKAAKAANEAAYARVLADLDIVREAIEIYDEVTDGLQWFRRTGIEEGVANIDSAREWLAEMEEKYEAGFAAGELDEKTDIHQEALRQRSFVDIQLGNAAKYDAQKYLNKANDAYNGTTAASADPEGEPEIIKGAKEIAEEVLAQDGLDPDDAAAIKKSMAEIEKLLGEMTTIVGQYEAYNYQELHPTIVKDYEDIMILIEGLKGNADNANAWVAIQNQIADVQKAIDNFNNIVKGTEDTPGMAYAGANGAEGEPFFDTVAEAQKWVDETTAAMKAKYEAGELTLKETEERPSDSKLGESREQVAAVYGALNEAAQYDANRYLTAAENYWNGNEADEIAGMREYVEGLIAELEGWPRHDSLVAEVERIDEALGTLTTKVKEYTAYNEDNHKEIVELAESIKANITDLVQNADEAIADKAAVEARLAAATDDMEWLEGLQQKLSDAVKDSEHLLKEGDAQVIEEIGGDKYPTMIQEALDKANEDNEEYVSPLNKEELENAVQEIINHISDNRYDELLAELDEIAGEEGSYLEQVLLTLNQYDTFTEENNPLLGNVKGWAEQSKNALDAAKEEHSLNAASELPFAEELMNAINDMRDAATYDEILSKKDAAAEAIAAATEAIENGVHADQDGLDQELADLVADLESVVEPQLPEEWNDAAGVIEHLKEIINTAEELTEKANLASVILGDLNHDGKVSVADYNKLVRMIVSANDEYDQADADKVAADITRDGLINVADINAMIDILRGVVNDGPAKVAAVEGDNSISLAFVGENNGVRRLAISLNNESALTAAQFDVVLPEGLEVVSYEAADRIAQHDLYTKDLGDGRYRVLIASMNLDEIAGNEGAILYLDIAGSASSDITIANAIASDAKAGSYLLDTESAQATGINSLTDAVIGGVKKVYNMGGQMINGLKKGVNIIIGNDGKATKVYKK